jgi:phage protein D
VVCQYVEGPNSFDITVNIVGPENDQLRWVDDPKLQPGTKVEIKLGYLDQFQTLIVGEITALHPKYSSTESARMHVQGFDKLHRLRRGRKTRSFVEMKDSQMAEKIAGDAGLTPQVEDTGVVFDYVFQNNQSDLEFLLERARRIRYEVRADVQTLVFRRAPNHLGKTVSLEFTKTLKEFSPRLTTVGQVSEVKVRAWNPTTKEAVLGVARTGDEDSRMGGRESGPQLSETAFGKTVTTVIDVPLATQAEADQVAHALYNQMALDFVCGDGEAVGNASIQAGTTLELKGLGRRFSGNYYLSKTEHRIGPKGGYVTRFQAVRCAS